MRVEQLRSIIGRRNWWRRFREGHAPPANVLERLRALLEKENIPHRVISHPLTYTAPELAHTIHASGHKVAKVVVVRADGRFVMAVLPSHGLVDLARLKEALGADRIALASESEMGQLFRDCETGAMPPFGNLYGLPVVVEAALADQFVIYFQAGTHHEVIEMQYADYARLVRPEAHRFMRLPSKMAAGF